MILVVHFRKGVSAGVGVGGYNRERAIEALNAKHTDLVCMGRQFLANPDLPRRWREDKPLTQYQRKSFYGPFNEGYIDYPFLDGIPDSAKRFLKPKT